MWQKLLGTRNSIPLAIVRLVLGLVMFPHGAQKMLGWFGGNGFSGTMGFFAHQGIPAPLAFLAIAAEFFGGLGLILGFLSRIAAFGVLCNMVVAVLTVHLANGFFMNWASANKGEGFEYHLLAIAMALAVITGGAGAASVDRALSGSDSSASSTRP
ncbi:MAG: DoxX family protein [Bryobacteraceae bacterium]|jgi:putative oxidoreductase